MAMSAQDRAKGSARTPGARIRSEEERLQAIWERAYHARTRDDLRRLYADWAETYDEDHERVGFFGHKLSARVLARHLTRIDAARVLDAGAGTGAAGEALSELGVQDMVAIDLSAEMLLRAAEKGLYRRTVAADLSFPIDEFGADSFDAAILVGVFSYGQAPPESFNEVLRLVRSGGVVVFTLRTDFYEQNAMGVRVRMHELERAGVWKLLELTEPAPYLPLKDPTALFRVWCYRVTGGGKPEIEGGFEDAVRKAFETDHPVKQIDHAWIWDSTASHLYERYSRTEGYYLSDCEEEILRDKAAEIAGKETTMVELGCGSARKIRYVLQACIDRGVNVRYLPIDVSGGALRSTVEDVRKHCGDAVRVDPRQGLFDDILPTLPVGDRKLVFFFGSSLGNIETVPETVDFLCRLGSRLTPEDRFVVGLDLDKEERVLDQAYNEEEACRQFFLHMVRRINNNLGADFDPRVFELASVCEDEPSYKGMQTRRVALRIAPKVPQHTWIRRLGLEVALEPGQPVQVGVSRKFRADGIHTLARLTGFRLVRQWFDRKRWFSLNEMVLAAGR